jgi:hypothetical protein
VRHHSNSWHSDEFASRVAAQSVRAVPKGVGDKGSPVCLHLPVSKDHWHRLTRASTSTRWPNALVDSSYLPTRAAGARAFCMKHTR